MKSKVARTTPYYYAIMCLVSYCTSSVLSQVTCPGQSSANYCDCTEDCTNTPQFCACEEAQDCCRGVSQANEKCEYSTEDGIALVVWAFTMSTDLPEACSELDPYADIDEADVPPECKVAMIDLANEACDGIDGLTSRSWVVETTCNGKTETINEPICTPNECSADDYEKYLLSELSEGEDDDWVGKENTCNNGDLSITVKSSASKMNIIGGVGIILAIMIGFVV